MCQRQTMPLRIKREGKMKMKIKEKKIVLFDHELFSSPSPLSAFRINTP
jgi:hypothetical protein